jgi:hypothetical protein
VEATAVEEGLDIVEDKISVNTRRDTFRNSCEEGLDIVEDKISVNTRRDTFRNSCDKASPVLTSIEPADNDNCLPTDLKCQSKIAAVDCASTCVVTSASLTALDRRRTLSVDLVDCLAELPNQRTSGHRVSVDCSVKKTDAEESRLSVRVEGSQVTEGKKTVRVSVSRSGGGATLQNSGKKAVLRKIM